MSLVSVALAGSSFFTGASPVGADEGTGRVSLKEPQRLKDTRGGAAIAANVDEYLPAGLLTVAAKPTNNGAGTADVVECGGSADGEPTFHFDSDGFQSRSVVSTPEKPLCLRSTVAIDLIVDTRGDVAGSPTVGGLQYEPLAEPEVVLDAEFATSTLTISRGPSLPDSASGATYSIEAFGDGTVVASAQACGQTASPASDLLISSRGYGVIVVNIGLAPGQQACVSTSGRGYIHVEMLGALNTTGPDPAALPPGTTSRLQSGPPPGFSPITPDRAFDTRADAHGKLKAGATLVVDLNEYLTPFSTAVVMNVTVTGPEAAGYLTVWPCDEAQPNASNLNFQAAADVPNLVTVRLADDGTVCITGSTTTHVLGDVAGTYEFGDGVGSTSINPTRIMDTRRSFGAQPVGANGQIALQVAGREGLIPPEGIEAVTMNVTVTGAQGDGYMTVWPCDQPRPNASNLNFRRGVDVPNLVTVKVAANGTVCFFSTATTHVVADAAMYYSYLSDGGFIDLPPTRVLDTRVPIGAPLKAKLGPRTVTRWGVLPSLEVMIAGHGGVPFSGGPRPGPGPGNSWVWAANPYGPVSVVMNITAASPEASGYLTAWPCDQPKPDASNLNVQPGVDVPNLIAVKLAAMGRVCFSSTAVTDVIADVAGYTTSAPVKWWDIVIA